MGPGSSPSGTMTCKYLTSQHIGWRWFPGTLCPGSVCACDELEHGSHDGSRSATCSNVGGPRYPAHFVRGDAGIARLLDALGVHGVVEWRRGKATGPGRHQQRCRFIREDEAMESWSGKAVPDNPQPRLRAALLWDDHVRVSRWFEDEVGSARELRGPAANMLCFPQHIVLRSPLEQLDLTQLISSEFRARCLLQIDTAV